MLKYIGIMLTLSCVHTPSPTLEERCTPLLEEILSIQKERDILSDNMNKHTDLYRDGEVSLKDYDSLFKEWTRNEVFLRRKVTTLYDNAYGTGCL